MSTQSKTRLTLRWTLNLTFVMLALLFPTEAALADPLAIWNFNDSNLVVDHGAGTLTNTFIVTNIGFAAGTTNNARLGDPAGQALSLQGGSGTGNNGHSLTAVVSTIGFANIVVSFATQGTGTGFNSNQFQYSLDGLTFVDFGLPYAPPISFGTMQVVFDLRAIAGLNANPNAAFRIVFNGATTTTGSNRIDNLVIEGSNTTIPEPATITLLCTALMSLIVRGRRRKPLIK